MSVRKLAFLAVAATALFSYARFVRRWFLRWGATDDELQAHLPGDEYAPAPRINTTRAITIEAPPRDVWPWLVQIGQDKGGFYSYSWLENLVGCHMTNADEIHPEWQSIQPGDPVYLHPKAPPLTVALAVPEKCLVLKDDWAFILQPAGEGRTRLIVRSRGYFKGPDLHSGLLNFLYWRGFFEPAHFIMERKMMLGIKERAEALAWERGDAPEREVELAVAH